MGYVIDSGNHAAAYGAKSAEVDVVPAYPITPQTSIVEKIADMVEHNELSANFIRVESEHSAMAASVGASAMGSRVFTATSSQGLALMHEMLHWAAGARLPIVMAVANRPLGPGWNIWTDQQDTISQRDTGWIQIYCANNQEVYDTILQAFKLGENHNVTLPIMVILEAFTLSHTYMPICIEEKREVNDFLPKLNPRWRIDTEDPLTFGNMVYPTHWMEHRKSLQDGMENTKDLIPKIATEFEEKFGRYHGGLIEKYKTEDADTIIVAMGATGEEAKVTVNNLREEGEDVGALRIRTFRPFPGKKVKETISDTSEVLVIDRSVSYGNEGPLFSEIKSAMYGCEKEPQIYGFIAGLGGRDITAETIEKMVEMVISGKADEKEYNWMAEVIR